MKFIYLMLLTLCFSCSSNSEMCDCLAAGKKLNDFSAKIMMKKVSKADAEQMKKLREAKEEKCINFQTMSGAEMLELQKDCLEK